MPSQNPRFGAPLTSATRPPTPRQMATFIPQSGSGQSPQIQPPSKPVQVRTVFVPPPMKMKSPGVSPIPIKSPGVSPNPNSAASGPKMISTFNLNVKPSVPSIPIASGISITPISKSNGLGKSYCSLVFLK